MSKVIDAWDQAKFKEVAGQNLARFKRKDIRQAISESRYAVKMMDMLAAIDYSPRVPQTPLVGTVKVVTILHASLPNHTGGYTGRAQGLLKGLQSHDVDIRAYTRPGFYKERVDKKATFPFPVEKVDGVEYRHLDTTHSRGSGEYRYMYKSIARYKEILILERPDVLHVRSTYLIALPALIAAHSLNIPVVYEVSGLWELVYSGRGDAGRAMRTEQLENLVVAHADKVVTMNNSMAKLLQDRSGVNDIGLVPNAVDTEKFKDTPPVSKITKFGYDVGYVGSLVDYEGLDTLLQAVAIIRGQFDLEVRLKVVGSGAELKKLKALASDLKLDGQVTFVGAVSAEEAVRQFDDVNVIALPRKSTPATEIVTPLKPFEAMAAGRPLVVSDVKALEEVAAGGQRATVFKSGDAEELAIKLHNLLNDRDLQASQVRNAMNNVRTKHNWTVVSDLMSKALREVARRNASMPMLNERNSPITRGNLSVRKDWI